MLSTKPGTNSTETSRTSLPTFSVKAGHYAVIGFFRLAQNRRLSHFLHKMYQIGNSRCTLTELNSLVINIKNMNGVVPGSVLYYSLKTRYFAG